MYSNTPTKGVRASYYQDSVYQLSTAAVHMVGAIANCLFNDYI